MRRWLKRILICLALGAVTTVGVAWGLPLAISWNISVFNRSSERYGWFDRLPDGEYATTVAFFPGSYLCYQYRSGPGTNYTHVIDKREFAERLPRWSTFLDGDPFPKWDVGNNVYRTFEEGANGWPFLALKFECVHERILGTPISRYPYRRGLLVINLTGKPMDYYWVPWLPVWPGFMVDTVLYGGAWFAVLTIPGVLLRTLRQHRGLCPMCKYDLRGDLDSGCSECGWNRAEDKS